MAGVFKDAGRQGFSMRAGLATMAGLVCLVALGGPASAQMAPAVAATAPATLPPDTPDYFRALYPMYLAAPRPAQI